MKINLLFFAILFNSLLFGQEYTPLLVEDNEWVNTLYIFDFDNGHMDNTDYHFRMSGNTIIFNEKEYIEFEYRKRTRQDDIVIHDWSEWQLSGFYCSENIEEKKVYVYYLEDNVLLHDSGEFLLYDFNLNVGDSINLNGFIYDGSPGTIEIIAITEEEWFGEMRTVYLFDLDIYDVEFKIIEGVGSSHGLNTMLNATDAGWMLSNFGQNLSTMEVHSSKSKVYPNPFTNQIQIDSEKPIQNLELFDVNGKLILSKKSISELNSNLNQLQKGIYILQITYPNQQKENIKLIKK